MDIAEENLKLLLSSAPGGMQLLLGSESVGGNAGRQEIRGVSYACAGANFVHEDGLIFYFENDQYMPRDLRKYPSACYRLINGEVDPKHLVALRRGELDPDDLKGLTAIIALSGSMDEDAKEILLETARRYNHQNRADITPVWEHRHY